MVSMLTKRRRNRKSAKNSSNEKKMRTIFQANKLIAITFVFVLLVFALLVLTIFFGSRFLIQTFCFRLFFCFRYYWNSFFLAFCFRPFNVECSNPLKKFLKEQLERYQKEQMSKWANDKKGEN